MSDPTKTEQGLAGIDFPVMVFDGTCGFCDASVLWILDRDAEGRLHFAANQSEMGRFLLEEQGLPPELAEETMVLVEDGRAFQRSEAVLRVGRHLPLPWSVLAWLGLWIPRFLRDPVYDLVARNRYRIAGKVDACRMPDPKWAGRVHHPTQ